MNDPALQSLFDRTLGGLRVADAMHPGVISCQPDTPLRSVARMMSTYRVHAIIVLPRHMGDLAHSLSWSVVSDLDLMRAASGGDLDSQTVGAVAGTRVRSVELGAMLGEAVEAMLAEELSHLIVVDPYVGRPVGVLSTLDVARVLSGHTQHVDWTPHR
jgi:signal-transduction protein with cAMP-binding, CBS, and nucleotidyltransferase domain